jgi:Ca2+-binding RTX toxin-like protein
VNGVPVLTIYSDSTKTTVKGTITLASNSLAAQAGTGIDFIQFATGAPVIWATLFGNSLTGTAGADTLVGQQGNESISGLAGSDLLYGGDGNDTISGGDDIDLIYGGNGNDSISGGAGNDGIDGGEGNDTISWSLGDGDDALYDSGSSANDTLVLNKISQNQVSFDVVNGVPVLTIYSDSTKTTVSGKISLQINNFNSFNGIDTIRFDGDNTQGAVNYLFNQPIIGTSGVDTLNGDGRNQSLSGLAGSDLLYGGDGNDTIDGGADADTLFGGNDKDVLLGGTGDDLIDGGQGDDSIAGGFGNDGIEGGEGNDTVFWSTGDGNDVVYDSGNSNGDILILNGVNQADAKVSVVNGFVVLTIKSGETVTLGSNDFFTTTPGVAGVDIVRFADGDVTRDALYKLALIGGGGNDAITGSWRDDTITGAGGDDTLAGGDGNDTIDGGVGSDLIYGGTGKDTITGGLGNDLIYGEDGDDCIVGGTGNDGIDGGAGNDTIFWSTGDGNDVVYDSGNSTNDILSLTDSIFDQIRFAVVNGVPTITIYTDISKTVVSGTIALPDLDYNSNSPSVGGVDVIKFKDGTTKTWVDLFNASLIGLSGNDTLNGSARSEIIKGDTGDDLLYGGGGNDTLDGGAGNDVLTGVGGNESLVGGSGNDTIFGADGNDTIIGGTGSDGVDGAGGDDTYIWASGDGNDFIGDSGNTAGDVLVLSGIKKGDILVSIVNGVPVILLKSGETISLVSNDFFTTDPGSRGIDAVQFADGSLSREELYKLALLGGSGNDIILGSWRNDLIMGNAGNDALASGDGNDTIVGGSGNDTLDGATGNDTFRYSYSDTSTKGDGNDVIVAYDNDGFDTLELTYDPNVPNAAWNLSDVVFKRIGNSDTITITFKNGQTITVKHGMDTLTDAGIDQIVFKSLNGTVLKTLSRADIRAKIILDSAVNAPAGAVVPSVTYTGFETADIITLPGAVKYAIFNTGGGNDTINASGGGYDTVFAGSGDDSVFGIAYGGNWIDGGDGNDTLIGGSSNDTMFGGDGNDSINAGAGTAAVAAGSGNDTVVTDAVNAVSDTVFGGSGDDSINVYNGNNSVTGDDGNDTILAGTGMDNIFGGSGNDSINGSNGQTTAQAGTNLLSGDDGDDTIIGGTGYDTIYGGTGNDSISGGSFSGASNTSNFLFGGDGNDTIDNSFAGAGSIIDGGIGSDSIIGSSASEDIRGGDGNDTILGNGVFTSGVNNKDTIYGGAGDDSIRGGGDSDELYGGTGNNTIDGGGGNDTISSAAGIDPATGLTYTGATSNTWTGGAGNDTFNLVNGWGLTTITDFNTTGSGTDVIKISGATLAQLLGKANVTYADLQSRMSDTPTGDVVIYFDANNIITLTGKKKADLTGSMFQFVGAIQGTNNGEYITGTTDADWMYGNGGNDTLDALAGNDCIDAGSGQDLVFGGDGDDTISGGSGYEADTLFGGNGRDLFIIDGPDVIADFNVNADTIQVRRAFVGSIDYLLNTLAQNVGPDVVIGMGPDSVVLKNVQKEQLSAANFSIIDGNVSLTAGADNVTIAGGIQNPDPGLPTSFYGGNGNDTITAASLPNTSNNYWINGDNGDDSLTGGADSGMRLYGGVGNDTLVAGTAGIIMGGGSGNDLMTGSSQSDNYDYRLDSSQIAPDGTIAFGNDTITNFTFSDPKNPKARQDSIQFSRAAFANFDAMLKAATDTTANGQVSTTIRLNANSSVTLLGISLATLSNLTDQQKSAFWFNNDWGFSLPNGVNSITLANGDDTVSGNNAGNTITGGTGNESFTGGSGNNQLYGGAGNDTLSGKLGSLNGNPLTWNDSIYGGDGNDLVFSAGGGDRIFGGAGNDTVVAGLLNSGGASIDGGADIDSLQFVYASAGVTVSYSGAGAGTIQSSSFTGTMSFSNIEAVTGTDFADTFINASGTVDGGAGADTISAGNSGALLLGGAGGDKLVGGSGSDTIDGGTGGDLSPLANSPDLITNGSFENNPILATQTWGALTNGSLPGWYNVDLSSTDPASRTIDVWQGYGTPADGKALVELDSGGLVDNVTQTVSGTTANQAYVVRFALAQRWSGMNDSVEVWWAGNKVATITPTTTDWAYYSVAVTGTGDSSSQLSFRELASQNNQYGPLLDNVSMRQANAGNDTLSGGAGADTFVFRPGFGNDVITDFQAGVDVLRLDPTLFKGSVTNVMAAAYDTAAGLKIDADANNSITLTGVTKAMFNINPNRPDITFG